MSKPKQWKQSRELKHADAWDAALPASELQSCVVDGHLLTRMYAAADAALSTPVQSHDAWAKEAEQYLAAFVAALIDGFDECPTAVAKHTNLLAHLRNHPAAVPSKKVTLNGHQLAAALDFLNPDGEDDMEQRDSELVISWCPARGKGEEFMAEGYRAWYDEYPEEGCIELIAATKAGKE